MVENTGCSQFDYTEEVETLKEIQDQCKHFAKELVSAVCKQAKRVINSSGQFVFLEDGYPKRFTNYDILACEHQTKFWEEINPDLEDAIHDTLKHCYNDLSYKDKFFIEYSECYYHNGILPLEELENILITEFVDQLNDHWSHSKKIQDFEEKRIW